MAREDDIVERAESLMDAAVDKCYDRHSDEVITICHACDEAEGHKDGCFVPALTAWLEANIETVKV